MQGLYYRTFDSADITGIIERIREALGISDAQTVCHLLGFMSLDPIMACINGRLSSRFLDGIFNICAEHGLSRMYILVGEGPKKISDT